ncbi:uncharacterized protein LOC135378689 [Ornithodoros turicata]|uniref:uncharacterized protein LOC135378689 n=1 Tax=Ornithodoros turicata TaxID=34597 RepID=UPI00313A0248
MVLRGAEPQPDWQLHDCIEVAKFDTYKEARIKLRCAEDTSDICSDREYGRGKRKKKRKVWSDESHEPVHRLLAVPHVPGPHLSHSLHVCLPPRNTRKDLKHCNMNLRQLSHGICTLAVQPSIKVNDGCSGQLVLQLQCYFYMEQGVRGQNTKHPRAADRTSSHAYQNLSSGYCQETLTLLHTIRLVQQKQSEQLLVIISKLNSSTTVDQLSTASCFDEQIKTTEELMAFEEELKNNPEKRNQLKLFMKFIGGSDVGEKTSRILSKLLSINVGKDFSLHGTKGKRKFTDLQIWKLMCGCLVPVNQQQAEKEGTMKNVEKAAQSWLRHAPDTYKKQQAKASGESASQQ